MCFSGVPCQVGLSGEGAKQSKHAHNQRCVKKKKKILQSMLEGLTMPQYFFKVYPPSLPRRGPSALGELRTGRRLIPFHGDS